VANFWPRRWFPEQEGGNRDPDAPRNTGDYLDGFGNRMTVLAVSNPFRLGIEPTDVNDRAPGTASSPSTRESGDYARQLATVGRPGGAGRGPVPRLAGHAPEGA